MMKVFLVLLVTAVLYEQSTGVPVKRSEEDSSEVVLVGERADPDTYTIDEREVNVHKRDCGCKWCEHKGKYLSGYCSGCSCRDRVGFRFNSLEEAQTAFCQCSCNRKCGGITYQPKSKKYTLRKGTTLKDSRSGEISWLCSKDDDGGDDEDEDKDNDEDKDKEDKKKDKKDKKKDKKKEKKDKKKKDKKDKKKKKKDKGQ